MGHASEDTIHQKIMPKGCSLTVIETCGSERFVYMDDEMLERKRLIKYLKKHPDMGNIFLNPTNFTEEINDIFDSVAIYGSGKPYPTLNYDLLLSWPYDNLTECTDIIYSGLISLDTFISPEFTTKSIINKLTTIEGDQADPVNQKYPLLDFEPYDKHHIWMDNYSEIFKHSLFPDPNDMVRHFSGLEERKELLNEAGNQNSNDIYYIDYMAKYGFRQRLKVSLESLMKQFPGNYIHIVCRATPNSRIERNHNPHPEIEHAREEIYLKRIPGMSTKQRKRALKHMHKTKMDGTKSKLNYRSSRSLHNVFSTALKKSLLHNQFHSMAKNGESTLKRKLLKYRIDNGDPRVLKIKQHLYGRKVKPGIMNTMKNWKNYLSDRYTNSRKWRSIRSIASS